MPLSHFNNPCLKSAQAPGFELSGSLDDFKEGTHVRLQITVTQATTSAISEIDKIVEAPEFTVTADELSAGQLQGSPQFDISDPVEATAQASVQWEAVLTVP